VNITIITIPEREQRYRTVGDWVVDRNGDITIRVCECGDERYAFLLAAHEFVEAFLCKRAGVTTEQVDRYDLGHQDDDDPGLNPDAPYHRQHMISFAVEILLASALGVDWTEYNDALNAAWERIPEKPSEEVGSGSPAVP